MPTGVYVRTEETKERMSKSHKGQKTRRPLRFIKNKEDCFIVSSHKPTKSGYIRLRRNDKLKLAHRLIYEKYFGTIPKGLFVCHTCDTRNCINPEHLFLGTSADNSQDMVEKKRSTYGERNPMVKLRERDIFQIRKLLKKEILQKEIATMFNVTRRAISSIKTGRTWAWLEEI